jgi:hypothetical protein
MSAYIWVVVPLAGIIGWVIVMTGISKNRGGANAQVAAALAQSTETNRLLAERVEQLDRRLASVEKTLNEVG